MSLLWEFDPEQKKAAEHTVCEHDVTNEKKQPSKTQKGSVFGVWLLSQ